MGVYILFILVGMLLVSSVSKFAAQIDFMKTLNNVGIARRYLKSLALAVPIGELLAAILLLIPATQFIGGIVTLGLFAVFMIVVMKTMAQNKKVDCNCLGSLLPEKMGWSTLIRLVLLMAMTGYLLTLQTIEVTTLASVDLTYQLLASIGILGTYATWTLIVSNVQLNRSEEVS